MEVTVSRLSKPVVPREKRFCTDCGLNYGEWLACEDGPCRLESDEEATARVAKRAVLQDTEHD